MFRLIAREQMRGDSGKFYLVTSLQDKRGKTRLELQDGDLVVPVGNDSFRIDRTGEILHPKSIASAARLAANS